MKTFCLLLAAAGALSLAGCGQDEYVYHEHTTTTHHYGGDTVAGEPSHMADPNTAESFHAESNTQ